MALQIIESIEDESSIERTVDVAPTKKVNIFAIYAKIFRYILAKWIPRIDVFEEEEREKELDQLILPSNEEWRQQVYYRLVELQRESDAEVTSKEIKAEKMSMKESQAWEWSLNKREHPLRARRGPNQDTGTSLSAILGVDGSMTEACIEPGWRITDIILAAKVLQNDESPAYSDEAEMRRVFGLVYDVLRYKNILNRALEDVGFWYQNRGFKNREKIVWLLLYDMQGRKFARRGEIAVVEARERIFKEAGLIDIEDALLEAKTHLAASVSRLRIGGSALSIDKLLPDHLRTAEGVTWGDDGSIAFGWVNTMKIPTKADFQNEMAKLGLNCCNDCTVEELDRDTYVFDPLCPKVVNLHEKAREKMAMSELVRDHRFVFLERSFCLGAAAVAQAIRTCRLCGPVVLTHAVAPRHTGYLAELLADIEDAGRVLAFGTGDKRYEYETYLKDLGITLQQCRVYSEKYVSPPPSAELERATIVLATPPCSYTGVKDIVDLAVARGGDIELLESLTNADNGIKQPHALLADQLSTLKYALTRPNVQFLIYEAHTVLPAETTEMIEQVVDYANRMAMEKYMRDHPPKRRVASKNGSIRGSKSSKSAKQGLSQDRLRSQTDVLTIDEEDDDDSTIVSSATINVPDSDLFVVGSIDDIYGENTSKSLGPGCFLTVIRRKEMMQFNSLFMIKVAESKGLFGDPNKQPQPKPEQVAATIPQTQYSPRKNVKEYLTMIYHSPTLRKKSSDTSIRESKVNSDPNDSQSSGARRLKPFEQEESIKRLTTPTHASLGKMVYKKNPAVIYIDYNEESERSKQRSKSKTDKVTADSNSQSESSGKTASGALTKKILKESLFSNASFGSSALTRATRRKFFKNVLTEDENENSEFTEFSNISRSRYNSRRTSRLHHPGGSIGHTRPFTSTLENVEDYTRPFPHLFSGMENRDFDASPDNADSRVIEF